MPSNRPRPKYEYDLGYNAKVDESVTWIELAAQYLEGEVEEARNEGDLIRLARLYVRMRHDLDQLTWALGYWGEVKQRLAENILPELMEAKGVSSINLDDLGYRVTGSARVFCSMIDKEGAMKWLMENGYESLIQSVVNAGTLAVTAKELLEEGQELPDDLFKMSLRNSTSVTKTNK